jgi:hypothetical protein
MRARTFALLAVPVLLTGCADLVTPVAHSTPAVAAIVRVTVDQRDLRGTAGVRDVVRFLGITGPQTQIRRVLEPDGRTQLRLPEAGSFLASSWSRSCARTCDTLRPADGRCEAPFTATPGEPTDLEVRFSRGGGCHISVGL